jgi:hypothetical protein
MQKSTPKHTQYPYIRKLHEYILLNSRFECLMLHTSLLAPLESSNLERFRYETTDLKPKYERALDMKPKNEKK